MQGWEPWMASVARMRAGVIEGYKRLSVGIFTDKCMKLNNKTIFLRSRYPVKAFPLSRQSVPAIPSKRSRYPVKAFPLSRAFRLALAAGLDDLPHEVAALARRVINLDLYRLRSSFISRQEANLF